MPHDPHTYESARVLRAVPLNVLRRMPPILGPKGEDERPALCDDPVTLRLALAQARAEIARLLDKYEPAGGEADEAFDHLVERRRNAEGADLRQDDGDPYDVPPASLAWLVVAVVAAWGIVGGLGWLAWIGMRAWGVL